MKIYTKTGDKGQTSLYDQTRVYKNDIRVESYGTIDELNANLGFARQFITDERVIDLIVLIQKSLFDVGGELATKDFETFKNKITTADVEKLETEIDYYMQMKQDKVFKFTLPGSTKADASLHICRTVCRRAERRIIDLSQSEDVSEVLIKYVNRLSDLLYALTLYFEEAPIYINFD